MATHSSVLAWRIPWMEEPGRLQSTRTLEIPLTFLEEGKKYQARIYADGEDADWETNPTSYRIEEKTVTNADVLKVVMAKGGGQAVSFLPID